MKLRSLKQEAQQMFVGVLHNVFPNYGFNTNVSSTVNNWGMIGTFAVEQFLYRPITIVFFSMYD